MFSMKKELNFAKLLLETLILTGAVAIIAAAVYFSSYRAMLLSAVFPVLELFFPTSSHCPSLRLP